MYEEHLDEQEIFNRCLALGEELGYEQRLVDHMVQTEGLYSTLRRLEDELEEVHPAFYTAWMERENHPNDFRYYVP